MTIDVPLDEAYLSWLYYQVGPVRSKNRNRTHWSLVRALFKKEFVWNVANDDNRVADGRNLRREFLSDHMVSPREVDPLWLELGCSFLEMLIVVARDFSFESDHPVDECFWEMVENLGLRQYTDARRFPEDRVDEVLDTVIWRRYRPDGVGGLFPLLRAREDQTRVEIWYQLNAYLLERQS